jgi:polysaccharide deacetylase 2 family uncharacterized protein YibQ
VQKLTIIQASLLIAWVVLAAPSHSDELKPDAVISIIIDDIGYRLEEGREMINLSANLTYAVLPNAPKARQLASLAHQRGKEVMLHMPMQSTLGEAAEEGVLAIDMEEQEVKQALLQAFDKVPHAIGMNNHQGSLLTRHPGHMTWVMKAMREENYFFVDSRTAKQSIAAKIAIEQGVPVVSRDVFLDHSIDTEQIKQQLDILIKQALEKGYAVGIGHLHPETLSVLREMLPMLALRGVRLEPISYQLQKRASKAMAHRTAN